MSERGLQGSPHLRLGLHIQAFFKIRNITKGAGVRKRQSSVGHMDVMGTS